MGKDNGTFLAQNNGIEEDGFAERVTSNRSIDEILGMYLYFNPDDSDNSYHYCELWNTQDLDGFWGNKETLNRLGSALERSGHRRRGRVSLVTNVDRSQFAHKEFLHPDPAFRLTGDDYFMATAITGVMVQLKTAEHARGDSYIAVKDTPEEAFQITLKPKLANQTNQLFVDKNITLGTLYPDQIREGTIYSAWSEIYALMAERQGSKFNVEASADSPVFDNISAALIIAMAVDQDRLEIPLEEIGNKNLRRIHEALNEISGEVREDVDRMRDILEPHIQARLREAEEILVEEGFSPMQRESVSRGHAEHYRRGAVEDIYEEFDLLAKHAIVKERIEKVRQLLGSYLTEERLYAQAGFVVENRRLRLRGHSEPERFILAIPPEVGNLQALPGK